MPGRFCFFRDRINFEFVVILLLQCLSVGLQMCDNVFMFCWFAFTHLFSFQIMCMWCMHEYRYPESRSGHCVSWEQKLQEAVSRLILVRRTKPGSSGRAARAESPLHSHPACYSFCFVWFEARYLNRGTYSADQASLKITEIYLLLPPKGWNYRLAPPLLAQLLVMCKCKVRSNSHKDWS